jgi:hypothetical protein
VNKLLTRIRALIEEDGECWTWQGALQTTSPVPTMNFNGKVSSVRRHILEAKGVEANGRLATYSCGNQLCVNPDHVILITRKKLQQRTAKTLNYQINPLRRKRISEKARQHAKITNEIANQIREASGTQRQIAAQFGVSQATVSVIRRGLTWQDYNNPFVQLFQVKFK